MGHQGRGRAKLSMIVPPLVSIILISSVFVVLAAAQGQAPVNIPGKAVAVLVPKQDSGVNGVITFTQMTDHVRIQGKVTGLEPGKHGFHIHEFGDLRADDGSSAGGHYDPHGHKHGGPEDEMHHAGDLGNITADQDGVAMIDTKSEDFQLHYVVGRAIVVHAKADDLKSQPSGDAGARVALGVIGFSGEEQDEAGSR
jgi:Cu-Zn family superoxide dismutase